jgi:hypothetical protein
MRSHRRRILAAIAAVGALVAAALIVLPARATPSSGVTTTILAKSLFDEIHVNAHGLYVVDNKFAPAGTTGWHSHPGPSLILVVAGTVTNYEGDDPNCTPHAYSAGDGFLDPGGGMCTYCGTRPVPLRRRSRSSCSPELPSGGSTSRTPAAAPSSVGRTAGGWG